MIKAVLFDLDGTLIDSNDLHVLAWRQAFGEAGHDVPAAAIHRQIGKGGDNLVPALLPHMPSSEQQALTASHGRLFKHLFLGQALPFPDARRLLERVDADGRRVVLASSATDEELDHYVGLLGIGDIVAGRTSIDDVAVSKPAPDIFAVALKRAGVAADEAVAVGDTPYDILAAGRAGIGTVAVLSGGFPRRDLVAAGATAIYDDVARLFAKYDGSPLAR